MKFRLKTIGIAVCFSAPVLLNSPSLFAQSTETLPSCESSITDPDGDGYGFENGATCLVTDTSISTSLAGECIDDNADGYGWNGVESCRVDIPTSDCIDTDPVGDGWGWDGVTSCRVVPQQTEFNELATIEQRIVTPIQLCPGPATFATVAAGIRCPVNGLEYYFFYNGGSCLVPDSGGVNIGAWGTGVSLLDGFIKGAYLDVRGLGGVFAVPTFNIQNDPTLTRGVGGNVVEICEWIE